MILRDIASCERPYEKALEYFYSVTEYEHVEANYYIAECFYNGTGVDCDYEQSVEWYAKSASAGHAASQNILAYCYYNGIGVDEDKTIAVKWYQKAAEQGVAEAQNILAVLETRFSATRFSIYCFSS
mgnify:CR=1 FL=1